MVTINSRANGAAGEREFAKFLTDLGFPSRRGQQFSGSPDSPDVVGGIAGTHCEVKRVQKLNIDNAMDQAVRDCGTAVPYVAHRKNGRPGLITLRASDLIRFMGLVNRCLSRFQGN